MQWVELTWIILKTQRPLKNNGYEEDASRRHYHISRPSQQPKLISLQSLFFESKAYDFYHLFNSTQVN